jgi:hypothetical protein
MAGVGSFIIALMALCALLAPNPRPLKTTAHNVNKFKNRWNPTQCVSHFS